MKGKNLNLYIYNYIKLYSKLPKHKPSEKTKYAYHCRKLQEEGKIKKKGYGVWEVIVDQNKFKKDSKGSSETFPVRSHGYFFQVLLPKVINWNRRVEYLKHKRIAYKSIKGGQMLKCRRHNVYLYDTHIDVTFLRNKSYISDDPDANNDRAIIEFKLTIQALSNKLKTDFKVDNQYIFRCHHAQIKNKIAKWHLDRGIKKFSIKDEFGKEWLLMDNSFNLLELETVSAETSTLDMKNIVLPLMNTLKKNPDILGETTEKLQVLSDLSLEYTKKAINTEKNILTLSKQLKATQEQLQAQAYMNTKLVENIDTLVNYIKEKDNR